MQAEGEAAADQACAPCHLEIYKRYRKTPMANASGPATEGFLPGHFTHTTSRVSYRVVEEKGKVFLQFSRPAGGVAGSASALTGQRELKYFLGSGKRGRTYLFEDQGYWFEMPINWYAKKRVWDMAPNYLRAEQMPLTLPVDPGCLRCHASQARMSLPEARNRFAGEPFEAGGITCVACHGDASAHLASGGKKPMARIGEMEPVRRDSVCLSCHLEGQDAVVHQGKQLVGFRPGDNIFEYASFFVRSRQESGGQRATSQWEALLQSGCKRGAGDKLTCTTCHDPHGSTAGMTMAERVGYYRGRCLSCHDAQLSAGKPEAGGFAKTHHPEQQDCAACHMPRAKSSDIAHEQVTDHRIPRLPRPGPGETAGEQGEQLVAVGAWLNGRENQAGGEPDRRDLGLAYAMEAAKGDSAAGQRALLLLREAERAPGADADHELHSQLGFLEQMAGEKEAAEREYGLALAAEGHDSFAAGNLALLKMGERRYGEAVALWERAFQEDPVQIKAGINLAIVECGLGKREAALGTLDRVLEFSPDERKARDMAQRIRSGAQVCDKR
jgi:predicted CXXCH cytochrome family protein